MTHMSSTTEHAAGEEQAPTAQMRPSPKVIKLRTDTEELLRKPQNLPAEAAVLGTILMYQQGALDALCGLCAEHFGEPLYAALFDVMRTLIGRGTKASPVTLKPFVDTWQPIDGQTTVYQHLGTLAAQAVALRDLPCLVSGIEEDWLRRQLILISEDTRSAAFNPQPEFPPAEILEEARGRLDSALEASRTHGHDGELSFACDATIDKLPTPVIKGILSATSVAALYAVSGAGKTFVAIEMAFCIGLRKPFMGRPTEQGAVLIVPLEGRSNLRKRLVAARNRHGDPGKMIACMKASGTLANNAASNAYVSRVITAGKQLAKAAECRLRLVIIDTLARALGVRMRTTPP
jgi:AAA domain/DnaB-like helicase N terminal domain